MNCVSLPMSIYIAIIEKKYTEGFVREIMNKTVGSVSQIVTCPKKGGYSATIYFHHFFYQNGEEEQCIAGKIMREGYYLYWPNPNRHIFWRLSKNKYHQLDRLLNEDHFKEQEAKIQKQQEQIDSLLKESERHKSVLFHLVKKANDVQANPDAVDEFCLLYNYLKYGRLYHILPIANAEQNSYSDDELTAVWLTESKKMEECAMANVKYHYDFVDETSDANWVQRTLRKEKQKLFEKMVSGLTATNWTDDEIYGTTSDE